MSSFNNLFDEFKKELNICMDDIINTHQEIITSIEYAEYNIDNMQKYTNYLKHYKIMQQIMKLIKNNDNNNIIIENIETDDQLFKKLYKKMMPLMIIYSQFLYNNNYSLSSTSSVE